MIFTSHNVYYVKSIIENPYLQNTSNYTIKDLVFKMMESIQKLYQLEGHKVYVNEYNSFVKYVRENQLC